MNNKKWQARQITLSLMLTGLLVNSPAVAKQPPVLLISPITSLSQSSFQLALKFNLPPRGAPGDRRGAATRDSCPKLENRDERLTALVPGTNLGLTIAERPTFWFYVPYTPNNRLFLEFLLKDKENHVYKQRFTLRNTPGIVSIRLPETVPPLEVGKVYIWRFSVICSPKADVAVQGAVERVSPLPEMSSQLEEAPPLERISFYAKNGLWFDTLTNLAELYRTNPQDKAIKDNWTNLWQDVELDYITSKPLVSCCTPQQ